MTEKEFLYAELALLREAYEIRSKPLIDRLIALEKLEPTPPAVMSAEDFARYSAYLRKTGDN